MAQERPGPHRAGRCDGHARQLGTDVAEKPLIVLLHGVGMSGAVWDGVAAHLEASFEVLAPTAAGHRGGPPLREFGTVRHLTDETERFLVCRGIETAHKAGNSLGGWMAIELARRGRASSVCAI